MFKAIKRTLKRVVKAVTRIVEDVYHITMRIARAVLIFKPLKRLFDKVQRAISDSWRWLKEHVAKSLGAISALAIILVIVSIVFPPVGAVLLSLLPAMTGITVAEGLVTISWLGSFGAGLTMAQFGGLVLFAAATSYGVGTLIDKDATKAGFTQTIDGAVKIAGDVAGAVVDLAGHVITSSKLGKYLVLGLAGFVTYKVVTDAD